MKLLLTSGGLTNKSISDALFQLVGKKAEDTSLVFIPTASNVETGDKDWLINDLLNIRKQNFKSVSIADISAVPEKIWRPQFEEADVLFFEGGNEYYLMEWVNKSGLAKLLPELLKSKVYVGVSAGSMITNSDLNTNLSNAIYSANDTRESIKGLGYVDFYFYPHLNSPHFSDRMEENIRDISQTTTKTIYALDDQSAVKVSDGEVEVVSEGKYLVVNEK